MKNILIIILFIASNIFLFGGYPLLGKPIEIGYSAINSSSSTYKNVEIHDYAESKDGIHKFVWAMYIQQRYADVTGYQDISDDVVNALKDVSNALYRVWEVIGYPSGNYTEYGKLIYIYSVS